MQVEMSLAELLINAIAHGKVPGVQFKRGWGDDKATFAGLQAVIGDRLDGARRVAVREAFRELYESSRPFQLKARVAKLEDDVLRAFLAAVHEGRPCPFCDAVTSNVWPWATHLSACVVEGIEGQAPAEIRSTPEGENR